MGTLSPQLVTDIAWPVPQRLPGPCTHLCGLYPSLSAGKRVYVATKRVCVLA